MLENVYKRYILQAKLLLLSFPLGKHSQVERYPIILILISIFFVSVGGDYKLRFKTSGVAFSGTNAKIYFKLTGEFGETHLTLVSGSFESQE